MIADEDRIPVQMCLHLFGAHKWVQDVFVWCCSRCGAVCDEGEVIDWQHTVVECVNGTFQPVEP